VGQFKRSNSFIEGLRDTITPTGRFQMTTDGFAPYKTAVPDTFGDRVDFAMLIKVYKAVICTSIVERSNLSVRMGLRRFTRLTNAFSKKYENHWAAVMLWYTYYNFCRVHRSLRVTPAMEAGITDHIWELSELLA
jgi:IS1 family transposase